MKVTVTFSFDNNLPGWKWKEFWTDIFEYAITRYTAQDAICLNVKVEEEDELPEETFLCEMIE